MKRIICMVLMTAMLFSVSAFAVEEGFTLHNGTKFGMEFSEIARIEKENGIVLKEEVNGSSSFLSAETRIANQDNTRITYYFIEGSLYQMRYHFTDIDSYVGIENGLINKYGETSYSSLTGIAFPAIKGVFTPFESYSDGGSMCVAQYNRKDYSHRLIQISDMDYVFIEHYTTENNLVYPDIPKYNYTYYDHWLRYTIVDAETAQLILDGIEKGNDDL